MIKRGLMAVLILCSMGLVASAQEQDCSISGLQRSVDLAYSNYAQSRDDLNGPEGAYESAAEFQRVLEDIIAQCEPQNANNDDDDIQVVEDIGEGTLNSPYRLGTPIETENVILTVIDIEREANAEIDEATFDLSAVSTPDETTEGEDEAEGTEGETAIEPEVNQVEWVIVEVELECPQTRRDECEITPLNFAIQGQGEDIYPAELVYIEDIALDNILPGRSRIRRVPVPIGIGEPNILLMFYPLPTQSEEVLYFSVTD